VKKLKFDLDPTIGKVIGIGLLLFFEALLGGFLLILQRGTQPTWLEIATVLCIAGISIVTYFLTFLRGEVEES